jgi:hypothetical protein
MTVVTMDEWKTASAGHCDGCGHEVFNCEPRCWRIDRRRYDRFRDGAVKHTITARHLYCGTCSSKAPRPMLEQFWVEEFPE